MQVHNITPAQNVTPNFKAIKSIKCEGLYKKYPTEANKLINAFQNNKIVMDFCKKYDVDIVFYACKQAMERIESSIHIFFQNPIKKRFFGLFEGAKDQICLHSHGSEYNLNESMKKSTEKLVDYISPEVPGKPSGLLESHVMSKRIEIQKVLNKKADEAAAKSRKKLMAEEAQKRLNNENSILAKNIENLIKKSK